MNINAIYLIIQKNIYYIKINVKLSQIYIILFLERYLHYGVKIRLKTQRSLRKAVH
jgi:hypothetical protein